MPVGKEPSTELGVTLKNVPIDPAVPGALALACLFNPNVLPVNVIAPLALVKNRFTYGN
ncbi:hypothetical protein [Priestia megaterium]|uniref:hypothetical protein n=1 Tax=Priestia megaterium TaxID=1404 RepID=UPI002E1DECA3|nr:hypothetical protein [Priestia megaterium]